jgi:hypothetical protein
MSTRKPLYMWTGSEWILVGDGTGITAQSASVIYATKEELANIDLTPYLTSSNASSTYLPKSGGNINGSLIIDGDLTVSGSTIYLNTTELNIEDNLITLNYGISGSPSISAGIEIERGTSPNVSIQWNESNDRWEFTKDGSNFKELGSGAVLYQSASPNAVALGLEVGSVWIDSDAVSEDAVGVNHIHGQYITIGTASSTYLTQSNASNLYLTQTDASATYATIASLNNIDLTSTINTASAAAYASASAYTNQQVENIDLSPYETIANASVVYLSQESASTTYATQTQLLTKADKLVTLNPQSISYTLELSDSNKAIPINNSSANNVTVPLNSSVEFPIGTVITLIQTGTGQTTIVATAGVTIQSENSKLKIKGQYAVAGLLKTDTNIWVAFGNLTA